jgi:hypothetical protein
VARVCPSQACSPGHFKVTVRNKYRRRTNHRLLPVLRREAKPSDYTTESQISFAKNVMMREAHEGIGRTVTEALGIGASGKRTLGDGLIKTGAVKQNGRPMAAPTCKRLCNGPFLTHVNAELNVVKTMLSDVGRKRMTLVHELLLAILKIALKTWFQSMKRVFRALFSRCLRARGITDAELQSILAKKIANIFQNVRFFGEIVARELSLDPFEGIGQQRLQELIHTLRGIPLHTI